MVVVLITTLVHQGTAQLPCKWCSSLLWVIVCQMVLSFTESLLRHKSEAMLPDLVRPIGFNRRRHLSFPPPPLSPFSLKHAVAPDFSASQYFTAEGREQTIRLSAPILTGVSIPAFNGSIEVYITAVDLPGSAVFGKYMIINLQLHLYVKHVLHVTFCLYMIPFSVCL